MEMAKKKVLIVDDDAEIAELTRKYLEKKGFEAIAASSGLLGLELLKKEWFDVLISDISMPDMGGEEFVTKARGIYPDLVILLITGYVSFDRTQKARDLGVHEYLTKPVELEKLCNSIEQGLKLAQEKRQVR